MRTSTLPEELGRIEHLLSDKTWTLIQYGTSFLLPMHPFPHCKPFPYYTEMEMRKPHMGTVSYGSCMRLPISYMLRSVLETRVRFICSLSVFPVHKTPTAHKRQMSLMTGAQLAIRGRRYICFVPRCVTMWVSRRFSCSLVLTILEYRSHQYQTMMELSLTKHCHQTE